MHNAIHWQLTHVKELGGGLAGALRAVTDAAGAAGDRGAAPVEP